jgi:hypothetical protein
MRGITIATGKSITITTRSGGIIMVATVITIVARTIHIEVILIATTAMPAQAMEAPATSATNFRAED